MTVHNHGPNEGPGLDCPERRIDGKLRGACVGWDTDQDHVCDSGDFDRTICACGVMHSHCTTCGDRQDACTVQAAQDRPRRDETPSGGGTDGQDAPDASTARLRVLAEAHADEADRLAHTTAGITHALLAHFWLNNAQEQPR